MNLTELGIPGESERKIDLIQNWRTLYYGIKQFRI